MAFLIILGIIFVVFGIPFIVMGISDSRAQYRYMIHSIEKKIKKPVNLICFEDFRSSYNLNPNRWIKYSDGVCYRNNLNNPNEDEYFCFKTQREHNKYQKWLEDHSSAKEKMMFNMITDLKAITPVNSEHAESIRIAIATINVKYPNLASKYGDGDNNDEPSTDN